MSRIYPLFIKRLGLALVIAAIAVGAYFFQRNSSIIINWINTLGYIAPILFLFLYCVATIFFLPTMVLTFAGGALFGPVWGTLFNLFGASLGAAFAFCISRYWLFDWVATKKNSRINKLIAGVESRGWQFVALLRIVPIIPFNLVNYGLGVTRIKFSHYLITTAIFLIPTEIVSTYCGYAGMDILTHPGEIYTRTHIAFFLFFASSLFILIKLIKRKQKHHLI